LVQIELGAKPLAAGKALEVAADLHPTAVTEIPRALRSDQTLVTARFDAHANVSPGGLIEIAVTADRLHFFDLTTGRRIR
jgi:hypothetical protein